MSNEVRNVDSRIFDRIGELRDRQLLGGAMATSALVAMADDRVAMSESLTVQTVLTRAELLKDCDRELALDLYTDHIDRIRADFEEGKQDALKAIRACANDIEAAELIIHVGIAIAKADSEFSEVEREMIEDICEAVGIQGLDALRLAGFSPRVPH
jgi:tellurite resistance protein TerB